MWKKLYELVERLIRLSQRVSGQERRTEELRQEVRELTRMMNRVVVEINRLSDNQASERERMQLWVENQMLKFERRLPPIRPSDTNDPTEKWSAGFQE